MPFLHADCPDCQDSAHDSRQSDALGRPALLHLTRALPDEAATIALGGELASALSPGLVIWLNGDLGAGKTTLTRAMLRALGYAEAVKSPTYALVEVYAVSNLYLHHFDFYRFNEPEEFEDAGLGEYFQKNAVCLIEWPEKAIPYVPAPDLVADFQFLPPMQGLSGLNELAGRQIKWRAYSELGRQCLSTLQNP